MKKKCVAFLEWLRPKLLSKHFQPLNCVLRNGCSYFLLILFASCGVQNEMDTDDFERIYPDFKARFYDHLDTIQFQNDSKVYTRSLMKDLTQVETIDYSKPVMLEIKKDALFLTVHDQSNKKYMVQYFGKQSGKKFVFYTNYETINFPIIYITKEVTKYTVYLSRQNEMIFKDYNEHQVMMLFFGAGGSSNRIYKFKLLKNE